MNHSDERRDGEMRRGASLEHGIDHTRDHLAWSRRRFLFTAGAAAGTSMMVGKMPVSAHAYHPVLSQLRDLNTDRTLVILQLAGGFDGLNTIIPVHDPVYNNARPNLRITESEAVMLDDEFGLHPSLAPLFPLWDAGQMAVIHNVGYPDSSRSHFRGTDIWTSSSGADQDWSDGWVGRTMEQEFPDIAETPTEYPLVVEIGSKPSQIARGASGDLGIAIKSPEEFYQIAATGQVFDSSDVPTNTMGLELSFLLEVANKANRYASKVNEAANAAANLVDYPDTQIAESLSIVSRLMRGGLGSSVYVIRLSGFDTHGDQEARLTKLYGRMGPAIAAFQTDLELGSAAEKALLMTFSEFGRRVAENGSGTDHGTSNPMLLFGSDTNLQGGFHGTKADLNNLNNRGNTIFSTDFRNVYGTALNGWLGVDCGKVDLGVGFKIESLGFIKPGASEGSCNVSLPVELVNFRVTESEEGVLAEWETASEQGNAGFEIQVSSRNQTFQPVATIEGQGTTATATKYSHLMRLDPGPYRIRLLQSDFDGTTSYSETLEIEVTVRASIAVKPPFPNPVASRATMEFAVREPGEVKMDIYDVQGRHIRSIYGNDVQADRTYRVRFDATDLASGVYSVRTTSGRHVRVDSFVVAK